MILEEKSFFTKHFVLAVLFGAFISTFLMSAYTVIATEGSRIEMVWSAIGLSPTIFFIFFVISSFLGFCVCFPLGRHIEKNLLSEILFLFFSALIFLLLGVLFAGLNFSFEKNFLKAVFVFLCFFIGGLFSSSFYVSLKKVLGDS